MKIKGRPILSYLLSHFQDYGFRRFVVAVGYKSKAFTRYFKTDHRDLSVEIVDSGDADIIKRIQDASDLLPGDFIMCYGDTLADINLDDLIRFHRRHERELTITCYPLQSQFGVMEIGENGRVRSFVEKPVLDKWINIGYYYFSRRIMDRVHRHHRFLDFLHDTIDDGNLFSYRHRGVHITVNTVRELEDAEHNIVQFEKM